MNKGKCGECKHYIPLLNTKCVGVCKQDDNPVLKSASCHIVIDTKNPRHRMVQVFELGKSGDHSNTRL
jgi:hypothetical protein